MILPSGARTKALACWVTLSEKERRFLHRCRTRVEVPVRVVTGQRKVTSNGPGGDIYSIASDNELAVRLQHNAICFGARVEEVGDLFATAAETKVGAGVGIEARQGKSNIPIETVVGGTAN